MSNEILAERCMRLARIGRDAMGWIDTPPNAERIGAERNSMLRTLRRAVRRATKLGRSARTRMSISVFGPSQAGKSFLVSVLARPAGGRLVADFGGTPLDYISELNPEGEGESTGLVTRFTTAREVLPPGFPIHLRFLSEADIARMLVNSFFMDGDQSEPTPEPSEIAAHIEAFTARANAHGGGVIHAGMTYEEVVEIEQYVESNFRQSAHCVALKPFWEPAAMLVPQLAPADRAEFLAILWGRHAPMTRLFQELSATLAKIGHAEDVLVGLDAVTPRETSILDVKTLGAVLDPAAAGDTIDVVTQDGLRASLPRARVCALAAELILPMRDEPHPLFATTDLLDFPGARNRFNKSLAATLVDPATVPGLLLRGKVAYLFDRYVENQEITSMLLCLPDSNMETVDLPRLVSTWIDQTHGPRPELRANVDCILFFVLTKFDKHLGDSAAAGGDTTRFQRRMEASLREKFSNGMDNWVDNWAPGRPFNNCYWLRNTNYYVEGLIDYDEARREVCIRPEKQARMAELKAGCLAAEAVRQHFSDPEAAWDAALTLNDGGVSHLIAALTRVCKPMQKLQQIEQQLHRVVADMVKTLEPYHIADDVQKRITDKERMAGEIIDDLMTALERHRFGALLSALMVDQDRIEENIIRVPSNIRIGKAVTMAAGMPVAAGAPGGPARPGAPARPGRPVAAEPSVASTAAAKAVPEEMAVRTMSLEDFQADVAIQQWIDNLKRFREDEDFQAHCGMRGQIVADLVAELIHAARRTGLARRIGEQLAEISYGLTVESVASPAAMMAAERVNEFVATLGYSAVPEERRPRVTAEGAESRPVFAARPQRYDVAGLPVAPRAIASEAWEDWVFALHEVMRDNAKDGGGGEIDIEQNLLLGTILAGIRGEVRS